DLAASDRQQFLLICLGPPTSWSRRQPFLDQVAEALLGLLLLVSAHQVTDVLARVAVVARSNSRVDVLTHRFRQGEAHGLTTHSGILAAVTTVVNMARPFSHRTGYGRPAPPLEVACASHGGPLSCPLTNEQAPLPDLPKACCNAASS